MRSRPVHRGFSLVELLVAMVIGAVIGTAMIRVLLTQNMFIREQRSWSESRIVATSSLGLLQSEMRMAEVRRDLSTGITQATATVFEFYMPVAFGVACGTSTALIQPYDSLRLTLSQYGGKQFDGYATRQATGAYNYYPQSGSSWLTIPSSSYSECQNAPAMAVLPSLTPVKLASGSWSGYLARGNALMFFDKVRYRIAASQTYSGKLALYRKFGAAAAPDSVEIVAPLDTGARFRYYIGNSDDVPEDTVPTNLTRIRGLQIALPGMSQNTTGFQTTRDVTRLVTSIFFRNNQ